MPSTTLRSIRDEALRASILAAIASHSTLRAAASSLGIVPENLNRYMRRLGIPGPRAHRAADDLGPAKRAA